MSINYENEVKDLRANEGRDFFRPEAGTFLIKVDEEPTFITKTFENRITKKPEEQIQLRLQIEINKKKYTWDISKSDKPTQLSLYGQLMLLGNNWNGLSGRTFTLLVKRSKDRNDYSILEAVPLMKAKEENIH